MRYGKSQAGRGTNRHVNDRLALGDGSFSGALAALDGVGDSDRAAFATHNIDNQSR